MKKLFLGIDVGTSSVKFSVVNLAGLSVYQKSYPYDIEVNQRGWKEVSPYVWKNLLKKGLFGLIEEVDSSEIEGIGITGQMHTTVFLDKKGTPVRKSIMWNDNRVKNMLPRIKSILKNSVGNTVAAATVSTGSPLANILWVKENESENFSKIATVCFPVDYLVFLLTGKISTDYCDASTSSMYNFDMNDWDQNILKTFEIPSKIFPPICPSAQVVGNVSNNLQQAFNLSAKVKVVVGTGDNAATAIANKIFADQQPIISLGTSGVLIIPSLKNTVKSVGKNVAVSIKDKKPQIITQGTVQAGAQLNEWWMKKVIMSGDFKKEQDNIPSQLLGDNSVMFLPHLNGEKTLYESPQLKGTFIGITLETTRYEMYLAVLEGLAFGIKQLFEKMKDQQEPEYFVAVGGGTHSKLWCQIFANVLGYPIKIYSKAREAVDGATILAALGTGDKISDFEEQPKTFYSDEKIVRKYQAKFKYYQLLVDTMLNFYQKEW